MISKFVEMVKQSFSFLENFGFQLVSETPCLLEYESSRVLVSISWNARSGELNAFLGLLPRTGEAFERYSVADILATTGVPEEDFAPPQVADEDRLAPWIARLAHYLRDHASSGLAGDRMFFRRIETFRNARAQSLTDEVELRQVRSEADKAWREKKFRRVVDLYASIEARLTESESRRLGYAKKHLAG